MARAKPEPRRGSTAIMNTRRYTSYTSYHLVSIFDGAFFKNKSHCLLGCVQKSLPALGSVVRKEELQVGKVFVVLPIA